MAPWSRSAHTVVVCTGAGLAAALILLSCTLVAPSHRRQVALVTLVAGSLVAMAMAIAADGFPALVTAIVVGLLTTWWVRRRPATRAAAGGRR